jgi:excisionase family DNA binding protein
MNEPLLVSKPEAARLLGVHRATIARMIQAGTLKPVYLGPKAHPRIRRSDLEALVAGKAAGP